MHVYVTAADGGNILTTQTVLATQALHHTIITLVTQRDNPPQDVSLATECVYRPLAGSRAPACDFRIPLHIWDFNRTLIAAQSDESLQRTLSAEISVDQFGQRIHRDSIVGGVSKVSPDRVHAAAFQMCIDCQPGRRVHPHCEGRRRRRVGVGRSSRRPDRWMATRHDSRFLL